MRKTRIDDLIRIGAGAGFSGDRIEPAVELVEAVELDYLVFECLAERTIALAQQARLANPESGYDPLLVKRMSAVLGDCVRKGISIVTNMGAANPRAAARRVVSLARELGLPGLRVAAVYGDDVLDVVRRENSPLHGRSGTIADLNGGEILSANAYLGAGPIVQALAQGAQVVITGRVADPALFLGPLIHEFGWSMADWNRLGRGTLVGHLLECAGQITGGYFADPGLKDVPRLAEIGFPFAEVAAGGDARIGKAPRSGGRIDVPVCTEQLLYELGDPSVYLTPDVCADFSGVRFQELGPDWVEVTGGSGRPAPETLKVSVGYMDGFIGEGQISYAGANAVERGRLALDVVRERLRSTGVDLSDLRYELIGVDSVYCGENSAAPPPPREVRARVAGRAASLDAAQRVGAEVESLYTNGPAGGGGVSKATTPVLAIASALLPRGSIHPEIEMLTA